MVSSCPSVFEQIIEVYVYCRLTSASVPTFHASVYTLVLPYIYWYYKVKCLISLCRFFLTCAVSNDRLPVHVYFRS